MAIEEEFALEIPDNEADKIASIGDAIKYITSHPQVRREGGRKGREGFEASVLSFRIDPDLNVICTKYTGKIIII